MGKWKGKRKGFPTTRNSVVTDVEGETVFCGCGATRLGLGYLGKQKVKERKWQMMR